MSRRKAGPQHTPDRFVAAWARILESLSSWLDLVEEQRIDVSALLAESDRRARFSKMAAGTGWANLYSWPLPLSMSLMGAAIFAISPLQQVFDKYRLGERIGSAGLWNLTNSANRREWIPAARLGIAAYKFADCQSRSVIAFQRTVTDLVKRGATGVDSEFFSAIRIDPAIVSTRQFARRLQEAVASQDKTFLDAFSRALAEPISAERTNYSRLETALWFMHRAGALPKLNPERAYDLFVIRLRFYPALGSRDSHGSLWRYVQRHRKKLEDK